LKVGMVYAFLMVANLVNGDGVMLFMLVTLWTLI